MEKRRLEEGPTGESLELEVDRLQEALLAQRASEAERLRCMKLRSVAELAAGAGHEINNPLAVISGQSQYLLARESDPDKQKSLQSIIRQSERVHHILVDLMQFARPAQPRRQQLDLRATTADALESHRARATAKSVSLEFTAPVDPAPSYADSAMIRTALGNLVRNAIEAAPTDGKVCLSLQAVDETWEIVVEDSGPGPDAEHREHLFDPFYSGRIAGRGRGLGLATAWRLVAENNGDVRYVPLEGRPARFVLILPRSNPFAREDAVRDGGTALRIA
jgi:two-component system NtrC family sensor kinase